MKNSEDIVEELQKYFNAKLIGSYLLVRQGLLKITDINDIDVMVSEEVAKNVYSYLEDLGYSQTITEGRQIGYEEKSRRAIFEQNAQGDFKKNDKLTIDIMVGNNSVYSIPTLIAEKFKRGTESDLIQIQKVLTEKILINKKN